MGSEVRTGGQTKNWAYLYGRTISENPSIGLWVLALLVGAMLPGVLFYLQITNNQDDLWVNQDGQLWKEKSIVDQIFGRFTRAEQIIFRPKGGGDQDMLNKTLLQELYWFQQAAMRTTVNYQGKNYGLQDLCWSALPNNLCTITTPMGYWQNNITRLLQDPDIHITTQCLNSIDPTNLMACMDDTGLPVQLKVVLGGIDTIYNTSSNASCSKRQQPKMDDTLERVGRMLEKKAKLHPKLEDPILVSDEVDSTRSTQESLNTKVHSLSDGEINDCTPFYYTAKALILTFLLNDQDSTNPISAQWEQQAIMNLAQMWKDNQDTTFLQAMLPNETIPIQPLNLDLNYMVGRSIPDELEAESKSNGFIVVVSYALMLVYVTFALGSCPRRPGKPSYLIGIFGILIVACSAIVGYGAVSYLQVKSSMISLEVIPFLILAIGVDNMFIISQAVERETGTSSMDHRIGLAMKECFPSIMVACITEVITFAVGITTNIPALKVFCMTAVFAILANFILQMTAFLAILSWDLKWGEHGYAIDPEDKGREVATNGVVGSCFKKIFTPLTLKRGTVIGVFVLGVSLAAFAVPAFNNLQLGLDQQITVRTDGTLYNYFNWLSEYFNAGPQGYIVMQNINPTSGDTVQFMGQVMNLLNLKGDLIAPPYQNWLGDFMHYTQNPDTACPPQGDTTVDQIKNFLAIPMDDYCCNRDGICGQQYYQHIKVPDDENQQFVNWSRIVFLHSNVSTQADFIRNYDQTHQLIESLNANLTQVALNSGDYDGQPLPSMFAESMFYVYFEQYTYIKGIAVQNLAVSVVLLFGILAAVFGPLISLHVSVLILFTIFSMISLIYLTNIIFGSWGIMINAVSVVNLVTAIGFAVEFSVHTLLKYERTVGTKQHRIKTAMNTMGASVFSGIFCTKLLGISILAFAPSALFRIYYFRMYFIMIVLCGFYGLVFLPGYLSLVGGTKLPSQKQVTCRVF